MQNQPNRFVLALVAVVAFLVVALHADDARAQPVVSAPGDVSAETTSRYAHHIFLADAAVVGLGIGLDSPPLLLGGLVTGPVIHLVQGSPLRAAGSLGLRVGLTWLGAVAGIAASNCDNGEFCELDLAPVGALVGFAAASLIDGIVLAKKTEHRPLRVAPIAQVGQGGDFQLGVVGSF